MVKAAYLQELKSDVSHLTELAFKEDLPLGDVTAEALNLQSTKCRAFVLCRQGVVMAGEGWASSVLTVWNELVPDGCLELECFFEDGSRVEKGTRLFQISGPTHQVLGFERTFLNFLTRAIGIATHTHELVQMIRQAGSNAKVLDTRKTLPAYRLFDKYAVLCGGGTNHRMSLSDQILIKENHIAKHGSVEAVLNFVHHHNKKNVPIEIEVQNLEECHQAVKGGCDIIMLDNFTPEMVVDACRFKPETIQFEVSGGITRENISSYCLEGIDRISTGIMTHSVVAPDMTMLVEEELHDSRS